MKKLLFMLPLLAFLGCSAPEKENPVLTVNQGFSIHIPQKLRYIKLRVAYHLESDDMLIEKVEPIKNDII